MTIILKSYNIGSLTIQQYWEKFTNVAFWRIVKSGRIIRAGLLNKPDKKQITNYLYNY